MTWRGQSYFAACGCPIPRHNSFNNLCGNCGGHFTAALPPPPSTRVTEFRNDHGPHCTCFSCIMRRRGGRP